MYQIQTMNTYNKTQVTKLYKKMFGSREYTKEEMISNYKNLKASIYPRFQKEIDNRIEKLTK